MLQTWKKLLLPRNYLEAIPAVPGKISKDPNDADHTTAV